MVRKITASLLLIVFLLNGAGFINVYQFSHNKITRMLRNAQLRNDELLTVIVPEGKNLAQKGFKKINGREYLYRGRRYDIIRKEEKGLHTVVHLVHDSYEEELLSFLSSFFSNGSTDSPAKASSVLKKSITKQYLLTAFRAQKTVYRQTCFFTVQCNCPSTPYIEIPSPPPQLS